MLQFPATATTLHYEFYTEEKGALSHASCIHLENVDRLNSLPSEIMDGLIEAFHVPKEGQVSILYLRKVCSKSSRNVSVNFEYFGISIPPSNLVCNIFIICITYENVTPLFENIVVNTKNIKFITVENVYKL